ncbi:MAG: hypothetical protein WC802_03355 [Patescibacteria group bacterium]|jgi:hypothetical protein
MKKVLVAMSATALVISAVIPMHAVRAATAGDLIKCADSSAIYYLAKDGKRYVFPNESIYYSWYANFNAVKNISCGDLAVLPIGERIMYQPGTDLVKIPSDPSVFAVEDGNVLREIPNEKTAVDLFGTDWNKRVKDVSEAFWPSFTVGKPLADTEIPEGTVLEDKDHNLFRVKTDGTATEVDTILTAEQKAVLSEHALLLQDVEDHLGKTVSLTPTASATATDLSTLTTHLETVDTEEADEKDVPEITEVDEESTESGDTHADTSNGTDASSGGSHESGSNDSGSSDS